MKFSRTIAGIIAATVIFAVTSAAAAQNPARPAAQILPRVQALYVSDFRVEVGLSDEQFTKVVPFLQRFIQGRFNNAANRQVLTERLSTMLAGNPSDQEIELINTQLTQINRAKFNLETRFLSEVDPELTPVQRLKVRDFQNNFEQWLLQRVELARTIVEQQQQQQQRKQDARTPAQGVRPAPQAIRPAPQGTRPPVQGTRPQVQKARPPAR